MNERQEIERALYEAVGFKRQRDKTYDAVSAGAILRQQAKQGGGLASYVREQPTNRTEGFTDGVLVPLARAGITGVLTAIPTVIVCNSVTFLDRIVAGLGFADVELFGVVASVLTGATWWILLQDKRNLLWGVEEITARDIDGDGHVGQPEPEPEPELHVTVQEQVGKNRWALKYASLPIEQDKLRDVARAVLVAKANFSRSGLSSVLTQDEYNKFGPAMEKSGLAVMLPGNRRELTAAGRALLRQMLDE